MATTLPSDSRTMREISGVRWTFQELLLAGILDQLRVANWSRTKDARKKKNFPKSILEELLHPEQKPEKDEIQTFNSGEELKRRLAELRGENNGN